MPTKPRKKFTAARLAAESNQRPSLGEGIAGGGRGEREGREGGLDEQVVFGLDYQTPSRPDKSGCRQGDVLRERELLGRAGEVSNTCEDDGPLRNDANS